MNQSARNLVKGYRAIRSHVSLIMVVIGPEQLELFALESEKLLYFTVASTNINELQSNLVIRPPPFNVNLP